MSDNENEIFEKPKVKKVKKELSDERKQALRDQLSKARAVAKERREANKKKVDEMASEEPHVKPKVDITMTETEGDISPPSPPPETTDDETNNILQLQMDIEEARLKKKEKTDKKKKGVFAQRQINIDEIVERKLNEKLSKLNNKNNLENKSKPQEKKVSTNSKNIDNSMNNTNNLKQSLNKSNVVKPEAPKPKAKPISSFSRPWWTN
jgi:hypothetical protein